MYQAQKNIRISPNIAPSVVLSCSTCSLSHGLSTMHHACKDWASLQSIWIKIFKRSSCRNGQCLDSMGEKLVWLPHLYVPPDKLLHGISGKSLRRCADPAKTSTALNPASTRRTGRAKIASRTIGPGCWVASTAILSWALFSFASSCCSLAWASYLFIEDTELHRPLLMISSGVRRDIDMSWEGPGRPGGEPGRPGGEPGRPGGPSGRPGGEPGRPGEPSGCPGGEPGWPKEHLRRACGASRRNISPNFSHASRLLIF